MCVGAMGRCLHDYRALANLGIDLGHADEGADLLHVFGGGERHGDEAELCVAGFDELGGLRDVFGDHQVRLQTFVELHAVESGNGGAAVGGVQLVGDGEGLNSGSRRVFWLRGWKGESLRAKRTRVPRA